MQKFNKATAAVVAGAVATGLGAIFGWTPEMVGGVSIVVAAILVYFVPNKET